MMSSLLKLPSATTSELFTWSLKHHEAAVGLPKHFLKSSVLKLYKVCDFLCILLCAKLTDYEPRSLQISKLKQQLQLQRSKPAVSGGPDGGRQRDHSQGSCSLGATQVTWHPRRTQTNGLSVCLCALICSWCDKHNRLQRRWQTCFLISFIWHLKLLHVAGSERIKTPKQEEDHRIALLLLLGAKA